MKVNLLLLASLFLFAACNLPPPLRPPLTQAQVEAQVRGALSKDPILRWACRTPEGYLFYTNNRGHSELEAKVRRTCHKIPPRHI